MSFLSSGAASMWLLLWSSAQRSISGASVLRSSSVCVATGLSSG